jgi:DNA-directed RNA polymerase specialized sigma24 family protein
MNDNEIAPLFDIAPGSVKVYISRARKMAYKLLKESEIDVNEPK